MNNRTNYNQYSKTGLTLANENKKQPTEQRKTNDWQNNKINPEPELDLFVTSEVHGKSFTKQEKKRLIFSHVLVWIAAIAWSVVCVKNIYTGLTDLGTLDYNFLVTAIVMVICCIVFTIDAVLLNREYQKNISMYVFSWILNFVYVSRRALFVKYKRSVLAFCMSVIMCISTIGCGYMIYRFYNEYSLMMPLSEEQGQNILRHFLQENSGKDGTYGEILSKDFNMTGVAVKTAPTGQNIIVLVGTGRYDVTSEAFAESAEELPKDESKVFVDNGKVNVKTQLTFIQIGRGMEYHLSGVSIDKKMLKSECVHDYWKMASKKK